MMPLENAAAKKNLGGSGTLCQRGQDIVPALDPIYAIEMLSVLFHLAGGRMK